MHQKHTPMSIVPVVTTLLLAFSAASVEAQRTKPDVGARQIVTQINGRRIWQVTRYLASDELGGRLSGTEGAFLTAEYIGEKFDVWGLEPAGDDGTYYQNFTFPLWYATAPLYLAPEAGPAYEYYTDYTILEYSGSVDTTAEVVFAGYGISVPAYDPADYPGCTAPTTGYDDYAGLDVTDKIVLVFRHGPQEDDNWHYYCPNTVDNVAGGLWWFGYKSLNAYLHGARGMILVNDYNHDPEPGFATLEDFHYAPDIGGVWLHRALAEAFVPDLAERQDVMDTTLTPAGGPTGAVMNMTVTALYDPAAPGQNVLGVIPGTDPELGHEVVVVSAHYDHMGTGLMGEIYAGADDDASGTAVMMEIAKVMASGRFAPKRTVLFAAWDAEEQGLIGSEYYVWEDPKYPVDETVAVLQLDMVGVGDRSGVNVYGGEELPEFFDQIAANAGEVLVMAEAFSAANNSDYAPFFNAGVPAVMLQTRGPHLYYHTPADTIATIDSYELEQAGRVAGATAYEFAMDDTFEPIRPRGFISRRTGGRK